jgi:hypothetical protein
VSGDKDATHVTIVHSQKELQDKLVELKKHHKLPVLISVNDDCNPFYLDDDKRLSGDNGGGHVVSITGFETDAHGNPSKIYIDNQWGTPADHLKKGSAVDVHDLYVSTQSTPDVIASLKNDIAWAKKHGHADPVIEMEAVRLELTQSPNDAKVQAEAERLLLEAEARWSKLSTAEQTRERVSLIAMLAHMPLVDRTALLGSAHDSKMLNNTEYKEQLVRIGATLERNKNAGNDDVWADAVFAAEVSKLKPNEQKELWKAIQKKAKE